VLAVSWLVALIVFAVTAGQGYYTVGVYPALIAAGCVVVERRSRLYWAMAVVVAVTSAAVMPASLPILAPQTLAASGWAGPAEQQLEMLGWPREVGLVAATYRSIPAQRRAHTVILTANYGEAGAVDRYRGRFGLPAAYSGLNAFGLWGPPPSSGRPVVLVWEDGPSTDVPARVSVRTPGRRPGAQRGARLRPHPHLRRTARYVGVDLAARGTPVELTRMLPRRGARCDSGFIERRQHPVSRRPVPWAHPLRRTRRPARR
jgi:hypothetical protein